MRIPAGYFKRAVRAPRRRSPLTAFPANCQTSLTATPLWRVDLNAVLRARLEGHKFK